MPKKKKQSFWFYLLGFLHFNYLVTAYVILKIVWLLVYISDWCWWTIMNRMPPIIQRWHLRSLQKRIRKTIPYEYPQIALPALVTVQYKLPLVLDEQNLSAVYEEIQNLKKRIKNGKLQHCN
jgi:hypothetical protein